MTTTTLRKTIILRSDCNFLITSNAAEHCFLWLAIVFLIAYPIVIPNTLHAQDSGSSTSFASQFTTTNTDAVIAPGDLLAITVFDTPEFSGTIRVSNEGNVTVPLIGNLHLAGVTASNAAKLIQNKLVEGKFLKDPQVNISFVDFINQSAVVLGDVVKPGPVPILGARTLREIVAAAGGINPTAANKIIIIRRADSEHPLELSIDWDHNLSNQPNPQISPGDTVQVPRAGVIYVVGQVGRQGAFPILHEKMTMLQAISYALGVNYTSKSSEARLIRTFPNGQQISKVDIPALLSGKIADFNLENNDIIYVPLSASKAVITRGLTAALSITTAAAVFRLE